MAKITVTPTIVLAEFILFSRAISFKKVLAGSWKTVPSNIWFAHPVILVMQVLALVVVSAGVAVATVTDLELNVFTSV
ncbi:hypothetical protein V6N13_049484 [Hibiscus sabdariffa]